MTKQKVFHKELEDDLDQYISENCGICGEELIRVKDIFVDENDHYLCYDCTQYLKIKTVMCIDYFN